MSLNKIIIFACALLIPVLLISCGNEEKNIKPVEVAKGNDSIAYINMAKDILREKVHFVQKGSFLDDSTMQYAAGTEIENKKEWGIKFYLLASRGDSLKKEYSTKLLDGSFAESSVKKINISGLKHDLIYYSSLDYFLGSGGGEVFSYVIDFNLKKTYYAHLIIEPGNISLYMSGNTSDVPEIKDYFRKSFVKDYPGLKIVNKDISLK